MFLKYEHIQNQDCPTGTALTIMVDDLSSIPKCYMMEGENQLQATLWLPHVYCDMHAKIHTQTQNTLK